MFDRVLSTVNLRLVNIGDTSIEMSFCLRKSLTNKPHEKMIQKEPFPFLRFR